VFVPPVLPVVFVPPVLPVVFVPPVLPVVFVPPVLPVLLLLPVLLPLPLTLKLVPSPGVTFCPSNLNWIRRVTVADAPGRLPVPEVESRNCTVEGRSIKPLFTVAS
jgi:hypothetical protein